MSAPVTPGGRAPQRHVSNWNIANALTMLRILLVPVFVWLLMRQGGLDASDRWWAWGVFVLASITDKIDGDLTAPNGSPSSS